MEENQKYKIDWCKEGVLELINLWKSYPCLYDPKHRFYHNKQSRYNALSHIAKRLKNPNLTINDVKMKINALRSQYCREILKMKEKSCRDKAGLDAYAPSAYWFPLMQGFLKDLVHIRKDANNTTNKDEINEEIGNDLLLIKENVEHDTSANIVNPIDTSFIDNNSIDISKDELRILKRKRNDTAGSSQNRINSIAKYCSNDVEYQERNSILNFCLFISEEMKKLDEDILDDLRDEIYASLSKHKKFQRHRLNGSPVSK